MKMKKMLLLILPLYCFFHLYPKQITVSVESRNLDYLNAELCKGYNNCDMNTNGESDVLDFFLKENSIVFDIGGNVGDWSQCVLKRIKNVSLYIFEPLPFLINKLKQAFNQKNVSINDLAISSKTGVRSFYYYEKLHSLSGLYLRKCLEKRFGEEAHEVKVKTMTLDEFCLDARINRIDYLKIDTEGGEYDVLIGAEKLLKQQAIDVVQFEYGGAFFDSHTTLQQVYDFLSLCGYKIYRIAPKSLIFLDEWRYELEVFQYSNYVALSAKMVKFLSDNI